MKAPSAGRGFSVIEMMVAFAIMSIVLAGVVMADFGTQYWTITSETSNEALYKAKTALEDLRAASVNDFYSATSSPLALSHDPACDAGGLCYYLETSVTDISACSKYASTTVSWQVPGYPTSTAALSTTFSSANEAIKEGGDCPLDYPAGDWTNASPTSDPLSLSGTPTGVDALSGFTYISENTPPYLEIAAPYNQNQLYQYNSPDNAPLEAIAVARDVSTGRTYAYAAAATSTQFEVIDVTDPTNPTLVAALPLAGVSGSYPQGWRIAYYDRKVYIATRSTAGPEFHIFDVGYPTAPQEIGSGYELTTTTYGIVVRDQYSSLDNSVHRFAYLTTGTDEVRVLDVTDPTNIKTIAAAATSPGGSVSGSTLTLLGNTLYLGLAATSGAPNLYALDVRDPLTDVGAAGLPVLGQASVGSARPVVGLRASGPYLFVAAGQSYSGTAGDVELWSSSPTQMTAPLATYALPNIAASGIDFDSDTDTLYTTSASPAQFQAFTPP